MIYSGKASILLVAVAVCIISCTSPAGAYETTGKKVSGMNNASKSEETEATTDPGWVVIDEPLADSGQKWDIVVLDDGKPDRTEDADPVGNGVVDIPVEDEDAEGAWTDPSRLSDLEIDFDDEEWYIGVPTVSPVPARDYQEQTSMEHYLDILDRVENLPEASCLEAEVLLQRPELPTGCESIALTIALRSLGFDLEKTTIADDFLVYSQGNFVSGYVGNPFSSSGAGVYPPGIVQTADLFLADRESYLRAHDASGWDYEQLFACIAEGFPVLLWWTIDYNEPRWTADFVEYGEKTYLWYRNEHCVMLQGYDLGKSEVILQDPEKGQVSVPLERFISIYEAVGKFAVAIY